MYYYKNKIGFVVLIMSVFSFALADSPKIKMSGWGYLTYGKIVSSLSESKGGVKDMDLDGQLFSDFDAGLKAEVRVSDNVKGRFHLGVGTAFMMVDKTKPENELKRRRFVPYLIDAAIEYNKKFDNSTFFTEFGYLPVKYNKEVRNLGEYLFRSNCYPNVVVNGFELSDKEKVVGWHGMYQYDFSEDSWIKGDLFFHTEMSLYPLYNLSLSYMLSTKLINLVELGAGISHQHLIPLNESQTTPGNDRAKYNRTTDEFRKVGYIGPNGDTIVYTFRGAKVMGRITLDPKALFNVPIFGPEDLKIYSEVAVLGWKDYPYWYDNRSERMPLMVGFNFPAFKILDVLAVEVQYWKYPWSNNSENIWKYGGTVPYMTNGKTGGAIPLFSEADSMRIHDDDLRWSIYASKKIKDRVRLSLQFACDNMSRTVFSGPPPSFAKYTEVLPRKQDWYWASRIQFYF
jgi:hypothetical protein